MSASVERSPSEIAREAIRQLALKRIPPTPDNYAQLYAEISGEREAHSGMAATRMLLRLAAELPRAGAAAGRLGMQLERAVEEREWDKARLHLLAATQTNDGRAWAELIEELMRQWEARHGALTRAQKRRALDHVLHAFACDASKLHARLDGLVKSWASAPTDKSGPVAVLEPDGPAAPGARPAELARQPVAVDSDREIPPLLRDLLAQTIEFAVVERLGYDRALAAEAGLLAERVRAAGSRREIADVAARLRAFWVTIELAGETQQTLIDSLLRLLLLVVSNVGELVEDDRWLSARLGRIRDALAGPLDGRAIAEAERSFRGIVFKQGVLKHSLDEAKGALKHLLATFIDRLGTMAEATGHYEADLAQHAREVAAAEDIASLGSVLDTIMHKTRLVQADVARTRDDLVNARREAQAKDAQMQSLQRQLEAMSQLVREDPLTGALNRRGLEEAFAVEASRVQREGKPMTVALLDVDNFKALNDAQGHAVGDAALRHLAITIRHVLRPSDVVARYGGEEFVILLPGADAEEGIAVMTRVQRELTRRIFMHNHERLLVTFSAGVALWRKAESEAEVIGRADRALYEAKRKGKNRVVAAPDTGDEATAR